MPARINKIRHDENTRAKIRAAMIQRRLEDFIEGKIELSGPQVTAALGLLRKVLPDIQSVQLSGEVTTSYVARAPAPSKTADDWSQTHAPQVH